MAYNEKVDNIIRKARMQLDKKQRLLTQIQHKRVKYQEFNSDELEYMLELGFTPYEVIKPKEEPLKKEIVSEIDDAIASIFGLTKEQLENALKKTTVVKEEKPIWAKETRQCYQCGHYDSLYDRCKQRGVGCGLTFSSYKVEEGTCFIEPVYDYLSILKNQGRV